MPITSFSDQHHIATREACASITGAGATPHIRRFSQFSTVRKTERIRFTEALMLGDPSVQCQGTIRILVVDDFKPWRRWVCSVLRTREQLHVVGEVTDGLEAVRKVQVLRPDLILLDIGLPNLNGVEAARQISGAAPGIKIIFLTNETDADVVRVALSDGALGYVLKNDAGKELFPCIETVLLGGTFVSSRLKTPEVPLRRASPANQ